LFKLLSHSLFIFTILCQSLFADDKREIAVSKLIKDKKRHLQEYLKIHSQFNKQVCRAGAEEKYWELYREFRGDGHYLPVLKDGKLDRLTVSRFVTEIESKIQWINEEKSKLSKRKDFDLIKPALKKLEQRLDEALKLKEKIIFAKDDKEKALALTESKYAMIALKGAYKNLTDQIPFLLSYKFPVDHFQLRENYDDVKYSEDVKEIQRKNEVYFFRKIVQDGAQNPENSGSDSFLRAALDTLALELETQSSILSENLRHDLSWAIDSVEGHISRYGKVKIIKRLEEWSDRTKRELDFYIALKNDKVQAGDHFETSMDILSRKEKARYLLKEYVLTKQKEVYEYWARQSPLNRALFSMETILFNEVGRFDGSDALERKDVAQVVINRTFEDRYNELVERDSLYSYLSTHFKKHQAEYPWLNVMLKEGEFSFTYFFITGSVRIFCPEQTRIGKSLIRENVSLALDLLSEPNHNFNALRYFSRASMLGRISMDKLWGDYQAIAERPGIKVVRNHERYTGFLKDGKLTFLYDFMSPEGDNYLVYQIGKTKMVYLAKNKTFYTYRSPHYFKYFAPVTKLSHSPKKP